MSPVCRRPDTDIDGYVEHRAMRASHQLALRVRRGLEVQAAKHAFLPGLDVVVLHENGVDAVGGESVGAKGFRKKTALIAVLGWRDQQDIRDVQPLDLHCHSRCEAARKTAS